jgi:hypothetical protein
MRARTSPIGKAEAVSFSQRRKGEKDNFYGVFFRGRRAEGKHVTNVSAIGCLGRLTFPFPISVHGFFSISTTSVNQFYQGIRFLRVVIFVVVNFDAALSWSRFVARLRREPKMAACHS